ncbi:cobalamin biosynthesis protein CobD [Asaia siamensis]|uniref:Cobalamin biosynthesis protein CobD n=1 Tax=Asaia siamensis TaxID=110479 RepID=A0ABQ1LKU8_9PROT|nr:adenosylcobinamide-phosphate synthase CbiB [Asaia siamensis]GBR04910.1 cobalamin biosynthesis protein CobD/CbiB [Asaia siamensis NRIC 0323]GGC25554.1 cobalamin biosynthesis protein CobD [Asaia siamensis]
MFLSLTLCALLIEAAFGYPDALFRRIGHPVTWIGRLITTLEHRLGGKTSVLHKRACGLLALGLIIAVPVGITILLQILLHRFLPQALSLAVESLCASTLIAQRALYEHVRAVLTGLRQDGLAGGRRAVSLIVGRDPETLDRAGVVRAAIESLAENFSDGVVAPVFWLAVFGLPGAVAYKAINTADSMIGHLSPRYRDFGRAAALCDDCVNMPASRLTASWLCLAALLSGASVKGAIQAIRRDATRHRSPNAGWPEAAMAGALALRLAGPRQYNGVVVADSWMGNGRDDAGPEDLAKALTLYRLGCLIQAVCLLGLLSGVYA